MSHYVNLSVWTSRELMAFGLWISRLSNPQISPHFYKTSQIKREEKSKETGMELWGALSLKNQMILVLGGSRVSNLLSHFLRVLWYPDWNNISFELMDHSYIILSLLLYLLYFVNQCQCVKLNKIIPLGKPIRPDSGKVSVRKVHLWIKISYLV